MNYQLLHQLYLANTYFFRGLTIVKGKGIYLYDEKGKKYLDFMSNFGVNIFGHSHPKIVKTLKDQISKLTNLHCSFANEKRSLASKLLIEKCGNFSKVYWSNSGSEAVEAALKFAVLFTGKKKFIAAKNSYHGKTLGALSATYSQKYRKPFEPLLWDFVFVDFGNSEAIEKAIDEKVGAVILEPIQGEGGIIVPPENYLKEVREICNKKGVLLILDEVQTGVGRTGKFLASQIFGVEPDILCLGKSLGGGIPIGATLLTEKIAEKIQKGIHTSTFGGNPLACAGVLATLSLINENLLSRVNRLGDYFLEKLREIKSEKIFQVRGKGLMIGVELRLKNTLVLKPLQKKGVLAIPAKENVVRFLPPFIIKETDIKKVVKLFRESLFSISKEC